MRQETQERAVYHLETFWKQKMVGMVRNPPGCFLVVTL
jgi:hypothetical protein